MTISSSIQSPSHARDVITQIQFGKCSKSPLVMVHPASGLSFVYSHLGPLNRNVIGISNPAPTPAAARQNFDTIDKYAASYLAAIEAHFAQNKTTIILGGFSFGGTLALRMAQLWSSSPRSSVTIQSLVLLDVRNPTHPTVRRWALKRWAAIKSRQSGVTVTEHDLDISVQAESKSPPEDRAKESVSRFDQWHNDHAERVTANFDHTAIVLPESIHAVVFKSTVFDDGFPQCVDEEDVQEGDIAARNFWSHRQIPNLTIVPVPFASHSTFLSDPRSAKACTKLVKEALRTAERHDVETSNSD